MKKRTFCILAVIAFIIGIARISWAEPTLEFWTPVEEQPVEQKLEIEIYDCSELNMSVLCNRQNSGKLIVERIIGIILDWDGNGKILNTNDPYYNYINYAGIFSGNYIPGDIVITYCVYNPSNNYEDDVIQRSDWIVGNIYDYDGWEIPYIGIS